MSLLDQAAKNVSPYKLMMGESANKKDDTKFIIQPNVLVDILKDEMNNRLIGVFRLSNSPEDCRMAAFWDAQLR
mgnify:CR=1 FL=1